MKEIFSDVKYKYLLVNIRKKYFLVALVKVRQISAHASVTDAKLSVTTESTYH